VAAELAASRKEVKYAGLDGRYMFAPIAFENLGVPSASTRQLLSYLGQKLTDLLAESHKTSYLFQRCSFFVKRCLTLFFCTTVCQIVTARITRHTQHFVDLNLLGIGYWGLKNNNNAIIHSIIQILRADLQAVHSTNTLICQRGWNKKTQVIYADINKHCINTAANRD